jgi:hypothetical protein
LEQRRERRRGESAFVPAPELRGDERVVGVVDAEERRAERGDRHDLDFA